MDSKIVKLARPADPNIDRAIEEFLEERRTTLAPRTVAKYENVLKRAAGTVAKKFSKWLAVEGYISEDAGREGADRGAVAARELPRAERAAQMLQDAGDRLGIDPTEVADEDYLEFDHCTIARVGPGRLWLEVWRVRLPSPT